MGYFDKVINEYSRAQEDRVQQEIKDAKTHDSSQISALIRKTLDAGHNVYLGTDWHLWRFDKKKRTIFKRSDFSSIINAYKNTVKDEDLFIYMGDLIDGECEPIKSQLAEIIHSLPGTKILVRGNNDLFPDTDYNNMGFKYVTPKFIWDNIMFSHMPQKHNNRMNIHGHIHGYATYWLPYNNMIDVAYCNGRKEPVTLQKVINSIDKYRTKAKVIPEKFEQEFAHM